MFEKENKRESESGSLMFTFHVKMISIWTFPTDPGTENRIKYCRASSQFKTFKTIDPRLESPGTIRNSPYISEYQ